MIEFKKKDKNGRNIFVNISTDNDGDVIADLYIDKPMSFLFVSWTKRVKLKSSSRWFGHIRNWTFIDYEKWADEEICILNLQIKREEEKLKIIENIDRGRF